MKTRDVVVRIDDISNRGYGVARIGDINIEVPGAVPGEVLYIRLKKRGMGKILKIVEPSPDRIYAPCPYATLCGGCLWQDVRYSLQLKLKQVIVERVFRNIKCDYEVRKILESPIVFGYRGKMEFIFCEGKRGLVVGLREFGMFDRVVDIDACWLQHPKANMVLQEFKQKLALLGYVPYNIVTHRGILRYLVIRTSFHTGDCIVNIITAPIKKFELSMLAEDTLADSVIWSVNGSLSDVAIGEIMDVFGAGYIVEEACGLLFKVYPYSFYQSNPVQARNMFAMVKKYGGGGERALDLYSGIGTIALIVAENFGEVIGIEFEESSVMAARENADLNGVNNVRFIRGKVENELMKIGGSVDVVFVDPPRAGMHKRSLRALLDLAPNRIVYISCNPRTQAEDVSVLVGNGYRLEFVQPIDMLPHTPHIESICVLHKE